MKKVCNLGPDLVVGACQIIGFTELQVNPIYIQEFLYTYKNNMNKYKQS